MSADAGGAGGARTGAGAGAGPPPAPAAPPAPAIPHLRQRHDWDCGLACAQMVLQAAGITAGAGWADLTAGVVNGSVWTVDVALALARRGLPPAAFYTTMAGVNPAHAALSFYKNLDEDAARLPALFAELAARGVPVHEVG
jgi:hypothetical protein